MVSNLFIFVVVACIVLCCGFVLAIVLLRAAWAQKEREALSSSDLRILEESAVLLIEQLKAETDQRLVVMEEYMKRMDRLIQEADSRIAVLQGHELSHLHTESYVASEEKKSSGTVQSPPKIEQVVTLASSGSECSDIARASGLDCAEVKLMLRLANMDSAKQCSPQTA